MIERRATRCRTHGTLKWCSRNGLVVIVTWRFFCDGDDCDDHDFNSIFVANGPFVGIHTAVQF